MIGKAISNNPGFVQLRRIDAAREIATTIATGTNQVYLPSDALLLNIGSALAALPVEAVAQPPAKPASRW